MPEQIVVLLTIATLMFVYSIYGLYQFLRPLYILTKDYRIVRVDSVASIGDSIWTQKIYISEYGHDYKTYSEDDVVDHSRNLDKLKFKQDLYRVAKGAR